jgi:protein-S-isoprenylcysteine O-methyltransferase Ste14
MRRNVVENEPNNNQNRTVQIISNTSQNVTAPLVRKMGIEGAGLKIIGVTLLYLIPAYFLDLYFHPHFFIVIFYGSLNWLMYFLFVAWFVIWIWAVGLLLENFPKGRLITSGPYKLCLNPIYNSFSIFILPAVALYLNSWIYFGAAIVLFLATIKFAKKEEEYLFSTFGQEYLNYRQSVIFKL